MIEHEPLTQDDVAQQKLAEEMWLTLERSLLTAWPKGLSDNFLKSIVKKVDGRVHQMASQRERG